ncbi:hypothetical protein GW17_00041744 [Ensete ventricosum]|nr:hypothetical protein GW17_00041744 [Ensete ventricosum]
MFSQRRKPLQGAADHLQGAATHSGSSLTGTNCPWPGRRWRLPNARPQGAALWPGLPPARATLWPGLPPARAAVGRSGRQQGQRPRDAAQPAHEVPPEGSNVCRRGGYPRRRRAPQPPTQGSGDDTDGGKERARASF